jgi:DNA-binding LytR/AlgR family response regulator
MRPRSAGQGSVNHPGERDVDLLFSDIVMPGTIDGVGLGCI